MSETNILTSFIRIFAPAMYQLKDYIESLIEMEEGAPSELYCFELDRETILITNNMRDTPAVYGYMLVEQGWLTIIYNGRQITLEPGDLYIYSPGFPVAIADGSEDYHGIAMMADEGMTLQMPIVRDIIRTAYMPIAEWGRPVVHVPDAYLDRIRLRMYELLGYQDAPHLFHDEVMRTLYTLFLLDLTDIQERAVSTHKYSERTTEIFIGFMRLLPQHFVEHHDIGFYASELCITTTHLSRIVRQITGRTVMDYINQILLMEAMFLLQTTDLPLAAVADRLNFADQSSFSKFFLRMKGVSPKSYKNSAT